MSQANAVRDVLVAEAREAKRRMDGEDERLVELQASLMRRWVRATAELRVGDCTENEYRGYCQLLRVIANKASRESCPHHGKSAVRRAHAYAAPVRLGVTGSALGHGASVSPDAGVPVPKLPPASEWAMVLRWGAKFDRGELSSFNYRRPRVGRDDRVSASGLSYHARKFAHPERLTTPERYS